MDYYDQVKAAADQLRARVGEVPPLAMVLGSGWGDAAGSLRDGVSVAYQELPYWPTPTVAGHAGRATVGRLSGRRMVALAGRCHLYEGGRAAEVTFAIRVLGLLGVRVLILTSAAGGISERLAPGALMVIDDHVNLSGSNPLVGPNDDRFGARFPDMSQVYSPRLRQLADRAAAAAGIPLVHGVYAAVTGPSYETPAEIRYLRAIGVDAVGMSTVPEAIVARHMGIEVAGLACISNLAAGLSPHRLDHEEVLETTRRVQPSFVSLLEGIVGQL